MQRIEESIQLQLSRWLQWQHPTVIYRVDFAAGLKMSKWQAVKHKQIQHGRAYPDLFIAEMRGGYGGLFLELKKSKEGIILKGGALSTNQHIQEQWTMLQELRKRGYAAEFGFGIEDCIRIVNGYLGCG